MPQQAHREIRISMDWLRYTMPFSEAADTRSNLQNALPPDDRLQITGEVLPNARGYDSCLALTWGKIHWHSERPEQLISVEFTGQDCQRLHELGLSFPELWEAIGVASGHITRIDFAIDLHNYGADHLELEEALQSEAAITRARSVYTYAGGTIGKGRQEGTTYVGKSSSDRQLRVYNKGAQMGRNEDWTRIEIIIKGKRAKALLEVLVRHSWARVGRSVIDAFLSWETGEWWQAAIKGKHIAMPKIGREDTNTVQWLYKTVLPTLRREIRKAADAGETNLADAFGECVESARSKR